MDEEGYQKYQLKQVIRDYVLHPEFSIEEYQKFEARMEETPYPYIVGYSQLILN